MNMKKTILVIFLVQVLVGACTQKQESRVYPTTFVDSVVTANVETTPVPANIGDDSADDPAIFIHPEDLSKSLIIGTNKKDGLAVYNLQGEEVNYQSVGLINNVDLRQNFTLGDEKITVVAGSNRTDNSLLLMKMDNEGKLYPLLEEALICPVDEVYGVGMYISPKDGSYYALINGKDGQILQYKLIDDNGKLKTELVKKRKVSSQPEAIVADDELGWLYIGEEEKGLWKFNAEPDATDEPILVDGSSMENAAAEYDIEGATIYYAEGGKGYIIVSSQGNFRYLVFEREGDNKYLGFFSIKDGEIDGAEETDGLDVIHLGLNDEFPNGFLVVQDGFNYDGKEVMNQNFKLVAWEKIAKLSNPQLIIDNDYQIKR